MKTGKRATQHEPVTIERLERALELCARLVVLDGPVVISNVKLPPDVRRCSKTNTRT
jgi:hypothetical protein